jgi:hypothetical protein
MRNVSVSSGRRIKFLALLSVICFLLFGCNNLLEPPKNAEAGKGSFSLSVDGVRTGRTILPVDDIPVTDFAVYTLEFFTTGTTTNPVVSENRTNANLSESVLLDAGTYDLHVTAYSDAEKTEPAAFGILEGIVIGAGAAVSKSVTLTALTEEGTGTFSWDISYPADVSSASMTITPLGETGTAAQTLSFTGATPDAETEDSLTLNAGYYRVVFNLSKTGGQIATHREILHIYKDRESAFSYTFAEGDFINAIMVTNGDNTGAGSLRQAITDVPTNGNRIIIIDPSVKTITLTSALTVSTAKNFTIEGNGVTITRAASWTPGSTSQLLNISNASTTVSISRVHFKNGRATTNGAAINTNGNLTLESCIFSGNQTTGSSGNAALGGAIYHSGSSGTTIKVRGCTFYGNKIINSGNGAAIYCNASALTLEGNLFYGNTAPTYPVVYRTGGSIINNGYNVVDVALGTGNTASGFASSTIKPDTDKGSVSDLPISPLSFRLLSGSPAAGGIDSPSVDYPAIDFYGNNISASDTEPVAAGAVQTAAAAGYYLGVSTNSGSVSVNPQPDVDGIVPVGTVSITAMPNEGFNLAYWLENGVNAGSTNPLVFDPIEAHTTVEAVCQRLVEVTVFTDSASGDGDEGTLRLALTNAQDGDVISFVNVTAGTTQVELRRALPPITKSITIQGNGVTITPTSTWTSNSTSQLLRITDGNAVVSISRVHFKNGRATGQAGTAIYNNGGNVSLESCIFSGNQTNTTDGSSGGGAISSTSGSTLNIKGCTFYENKSAVGGVVRGDFATLIYEGNLFYGNTAPNGPVHYANGCYVNSRYNVVDLALSRVTNFSAAAGRNDKGDSGLTVSPVNFKLLSGSQAAGVITTLPAGYPAVDFYGNSISNGAAAGAVQAGTTSTGYALLVSVNNSAAGSISNISPSQDADGLYSGNVTITATPTSPFTLSYWLVNGVKTPPTSLNTLEFNPIDAHATVQAVFERIVEVTNFADTNTAGTLRYALQTSRLQDGDVIRFGNTTTPVTAGVTIVELTSVLPTITRSITIEGNGITITPSSTWTAGTSSQLLYINNSGATVSISRVHFKNGKATTYGAAINNNSTLTLESCIFSGNQHTGSLGGAVYLSGGTAVNVKIKGCTFYNNSAGTNGGAVYNGSTLTLEGNLFYGNTAPSSPVIYNYAANSGTVTTSSRYNVVDMAQGTAGIPTANNSTLQTLLGANTTTPFVDAAGGDFAPVSDIQNVMPNAAIADFPTTDFFGDNRTWPGAPGAVNGE